MLYEKNSIAHGAKRGCLLIFAVLAGAFILIGEVMDFLEPSIQESWDALDTNAKNDPKNIERYFATAMAEHNQLAYELTTDEAHRNIDEWFTQSEPMKVFGVSDSTGTGERISFHPGNGYCYFEVRGLSINFYEGGENRVDGWGTLEWVGRNPPCPQVIRLDFE